MDRINSKDEKVANAIEQKNLSAYKMSVEMKKIGRWEIHKRTAEKISAVLDSMGLSLHRFRQVYAPD
jgi:hypothetical protein